MTISDLYLVLGGARSGKSHHARRPGPNNAAAMAVHRDGGAS